MSGLAGATAAEIRRRVVAREVSCEEVTRAHLDRIAAVEPGIDAFLVVAPDRALDAARRLDAALGRGEAPPPLAGVPISQMPFVDVQRSGAAASSRESRSST